MQYQERQTFIDTRVGRDVESLRSELAQLETQAVAYDLQNAEKQTDLARLRAERIELYRKLSATPEGLTTWELERRRFDDVIELRDREISANLGAKNLTLDQKEILEQLISNQEAADSGRAPLEDVTKQPAIGESSRTTSRSGRTEQQPGADATAAQPSPAPQQDRTTPSQPSSARPSSAGGAQERVLATVGSYIGAQTQKRLAALKVKYQQETKEVGSELNKLAKATRPSRFAWLTVITTGIVIDIVNIFLSPAWIPNLIIGILFFFLARSLVNRSVGMQRVIAFLFLAALGFFAIPVIGGFVGGPLLLIVLVLGIRNPGVKIHKVNKEMVQKKILKFAQTIQRARNYAAKAIKFGRRTRGLKTITKTIVRSKVFRGVSKNSKFTLKWLIGMAGEAAWILSIIPFNTINAILTFYELKKAHKEAGELIETYRQQEASALVA